MSNRCSIESFTTPARLQTGMKVNCPRCGQPGQPVALQTLKHQVKPEHLERSTGCPWLDYLEDRL